MTEEIKNPDLSAEEAMTRLPETLPFFEERAANSADPAAKTELVACYLSLGAAAVEEWEFSPAEEYYCKGRDVLEALIAEKPTEFSDFSLEFNLVRCYRCLADIAVRRLDWKGGEEFYGKAVKTLTEMSKAVPSAEILSELSRCYLDLGRCVENDGDEDSAEECYRLGIDVLNRIAEAFPGSENPSDLGDAYQELGRFSESVFRDEDAVENCRKALACREEALTLNPGAESSEALIHTCFRLGFLLRWNLENPTEAASVFLRALEEGERLAAAENGVKYRDDIAFAEMQLAEIARDGGRFADAEGLCEKLVSLYDGVAPATEEEVFRLERGYLLLGKVAAELEHWEKAEDAHAQRISLLKNASWTGPRSEYLRNLMFAYEDFGEYRESVRSDFVGAEECYLEAVSLGRRRFSAEDGIDDRAVEDLCHLYVRMQLLAGRTGDTRKQKEYDRLEQQLLQEFRGKSVQPKQHVPTTIFGRLRKFFRFGR